MELSRQEFEQKYKDGKLRLAFIGMSNIGKSYTAMRLARYFDFELIEVDQLIWEELGHDDMEGFAEWQGQPYSKGYAERETQTIDLETKATRKAMDIEGHNRILDTPGSVIYTGNETLTSLKATHYMVYIQASDAVMESLKVQYFKNPKPLIWKEHFKAEKNQTPEEAILASYPNLLTARSKAYEGLADLTLSSDFILDPAVKVEQIFEALKPAI
jgi:shikimate kinase